MRIRKEIRETSADERKAFTSALVRLKKNGTYDKFVHWHHHVMHATVLPNEPRHPLWRNGAHRGPAFLPWHRELLIQLEDAIVALEPNIAIPYWNWTKDAAAADPSKEPIWGDDLMGGNGDENDSWRVQSGPFAHKTGNWPVPEYDEPPLRGLGPGLKRQFASIVSSLPTSADLRLAMNEVYYDAPPYAPTPFNVGFRNRLEGWITQRGDPRVTTPGSQLHNRVHLWVGMNMVPMTSPDDPVFFLHHCFVDKVWADWQELQMQQSPELAPHYAPIEGAPRGHNFNDVIEPWKRRISEVMSIRDLGYEYTKEVAPNLLAVGVEDAQGVRGSPFWAD
jgi:tyrosinase